METATPHLMMMVCELLFIFKPLSKFYVYHKSNFSHSAFTCACRLFIVESSTTIPFLPHTQCLTAGSSQPLHPRHEEHWSVTCNVERSWSARLHLSRMNSICNSIYSSFTDKIDLGEHDLKIMLQNHREKRKRQPVRKETWI